MSTANVIISIYRILFKFISLICARFTAFVVRSSIQNRYVATFSCKEQPVRTTAINLDCANESLRTSRSRLIGKLRNLEHFVLDENEDITLNNASEWKLTCANNASMFDSLNYVIWRVTSSFYILEFALLKCEFANLDLQRLFLIL